MLTIIISVVIGIIIAVICTHSDEYSSDAFNYIINSIVGVVCGAVIGLIIAYFIPAKTMQQQRAYDIEVLQDNSSINGRFFLGTGSFNGQMQYVFYVNENGTYRLYQIDCDKASIRYTDKRATVTVSEIRPTKDIINLFVLDTDIGNKTYLFEVPAGTIKTNYNLDAQ